MLAPAIPADEAARLTTLQELEILDTPAEERFDRITRVAQRLFDVEIALVSLVDTDRQWFKARAGLDASETPRDISFCGHAILRDDIMVVPDARADPRFADNPLVTGGPCIRFYAGSPITADDGSRIGTLCLIDPEPRPFGNEDREVLRDLTAMVERELSAEKLATVDELTGLANRRGLARVGLHTLALSRRSQQPVALLFFDLDGFKRINDEFGHAAGDRALADFAHCLLRTFRDSDVVARLGGDEFCVLTAGSDIEGLERPLEELEAAVERRNRALGGVQDVRYSLGALTYDADRHASVDDMLAEADRRMYAEKETRKARQSG